MKKEKWIPLTVTSKWFENASNRGFLVTHDISEFADNSIDAKANNIIITKQLEDDGSYTLTVSDDGNGIHSTEIQKCFGVLGYDRNYGKNSTSLFGEGSKHAIGHLLKKGECTIVSNHNGVKSIIRISKQKGISPVYTELTTNANGTTIIIPNANLTDKDHNRVIDWLTVMYYPAVVRNPNLKIVMKLRLKIKNEDIEIKPIDIMYRHLITVENSPVEENFKKTFKIGKHDINVTAFILKTDCFDERDLYSKFDKPSETKKGSFSFERAGVYLRLPSRYLNYGMGNFISMNNQHTLNNVRIEIEVNDIEAMKSLGVNVNKSRVTFNTDTNNPQLNQFFTELRKVVSLIVSKVKYAKNITEEEKDNIEFHNELLKQSGDFTGMIQKLPKMENILDEGFAEEKNETEKTGITRNRKSGYTQNRQPYVVRVENLGKWAPFMDLPELHYNKYIFKVNSMHPFYDVYLTLSNDAKHSILIQQINMLLSLVDMNYEIKETQDVEIVRMFVQRFDSNLINYVKTFQNKNKESNVEFLIES